MSRREKTSLQNNKILKHTRFAITTHLLKKAVANTVLQLALPGTIKRPLSKGKTNIF